MSLEERSADNSCQEKIFSDALSKIHSEEFLSPTRRSSRIRKLKVSADYCNIDEAIEKTNAASKSKEPLVENSKTPLDIAASNQVNCSDNGKDNGISDSTRSTEKSGSFFQTDSDEDQSFESMFDDIFGQRYTKTLQSLLPKKLQDESAKERKFFKRKALESPNVMFSNCYANNKTNLPTEDVSKVFKIISKPNILSDMPSNSKPCGKPSLKTYCNKRKNFQQSNIVESFGLPDYPIVSENGTKPITNNILDAEIHDASEITILDLEHTDEPWIITNIEGESLFPYYEEVRVKAEPVKHDHFRINGSFSDNMDMEILEKYNDFNVFTSTPLNDRSCVNNIKSPVHSTPKNPKTVIKASEIDIEAIKMSFKKILTKNIDEVKKSVSQSSKSAVGQAKTCNTFVSSEISFITDHSLTIENKEIEITNTLSVPKYNEKISDIIGCDPKKKFATCGKHKCANVSSGSGAKLIKKKLSFEASKQLEQGNVMISPQTKKLLRSSTCKAGNTDKGKLPKKMLKTDASCASEPLRSKKNHAKDQKGSRLCHGEKRIGKTRTSKDTAKKRLKSSDQGVDNSKLTEIAAVSNPADEILTKQNPEDSRSNSLVRTQAGKSNVRSKVSLRNPSGPDLTEEKTVCKRRLRSSSQENTVRGIRETVATAHRKTESKRNEAQHLNKANLTHDYKIDVAEKAVTASQPKSSKTRDGKLKVLKRSKTETDLLQNFGENLPKSNYAKLLFPLQKGQKSVSEIKIVITPLNLSQLLGKAPDRIGSASNNADILSPTRRKLRSAKALAHASTDQNETVENATENVSSLKNKSSLSPDAKESLSTSEVIEADILCSDSTYSSNSYDKVLTENKSEFLNDSLSLSDSFVSSPRNSSDRLPEKITELTPTKTSAELPVTSQDATLLVVDNPVAQNEEEMSKNATVTAEEGKGETESDSNVQTKPHDEQIEVSEEQETEALQTPPEPTKSDKGNSCFASNKAPSHIEIGCCTLEVCTAEKRDLEADLVEKDLVDEKNRLVTSKMETKIIDSEDTSKRGTEFEENNLNEREELHRDAVSALFSKDLQENLLDENTTESFDTYDESPSKTGTENSVSTELNLTVSTNQTANDSACESEISVAKLANVSTEETEVCDKPKVDVEKPTAAARKKELSTTQGEPCLNGELEQGPDETLNAKLAENSEKPSTGDSNASASVNSTQLCLGHHNETNITNTADALVPSTVQSSEEYATTKEKSNDAPTNCEETTELRESYTDKVQKILTAADSVLKEQQSKEKSHDACTNCEETTELRESCTEKVTKIVSDSELKRSKLLSESSPPISDKITTDNQCTDELRPADASKDSPSVGGSLDGGGFSKKAENEDMATNSGRKRGRPRRKSVEHLQTPRKKNEEYNSTQVRLGNQNETKITNAAHALVPNNVQSSKECATTNEKSNDARTNCEETSENCIEKVRKIAPDSELKRSKLLSESSPAVLDKITKDNQRTEELNPTDALKDSPSDVDGSLDADDFSKKVENKHMATNSGRKRGRPRRKSVDHLQTPRKENEETNSTQLRLDNQNETKITNAADVLVASNVHSSEECATTKEKSNDACTNCEETTELRKNCTEKVRKVASDSEQKRSKLLSESSRPVVDEITKDNQCTEELKLAVASKDSPSGVGGSLHGGGFSKKAENKNMATNSGRKRGRPRRKSVDQLQTPRKENSTQLRLDNQNETKITNAADVLVASNVHRSEECATTKEKSSDAHTNCEEAAELRETCTEKVRKEVADSGLKEQRSKLINEGSPPVLDKITKDNQCTEELRQADVSKGLPSDVGGSVDAGGSSKTAEHKDISTNSGRKRGRPRRKSVDRLQTPRKENEEYNSTQLHLDNQNEIKITNAADAPVPSKLQTSEDCFTTKEKSNDARTNCEETTELRKSCNEKVQKVAAASGLKEHKSKLISERSPPVLDKITKDSQGTEELKSADASKDSPSVGGSLDGGGFSKKAENKDMATNSGRKRGRPRRKSVDHLQTPRKENEEYKSRITRSKSVIPRIFNLRSKLSNADIDTRRRTKANKASEDAEMPDKGVERSKTLRRSKSFIHIALHSRKKGSDQEVGVNVTRSLEKDIDKSESEDHKRPRGRPPKLKHGEKLNVRGTKSDERLDFQVGDLAWAQIGSHPFWPCLVTEDPETRSHKKTFNSKRYQRIMYHVRFFGDNGRRAWIKKRQIMLYCSRDDLKDLINRLKDERKSSMLRACIIQSHRLDKWQHAVNEAEFLKSKSLREKLSFFRKMFTTKVAQKQTTPVDDGNKPPLVKRKRNDTVVESETTQDDVEEKSPARKRLKKNVTEVTDKVETAEAEKAVAVDNLNKSASIEDNSHQSESISFNMRLRKQIDEISDVDSKSSDNTTETTLYSMEAQKALFKRNNLFKGVPRDKVCQHCCDPGEVLKCRGRCNGSYHVDCATKILQEKVVKKKGDKSICKNQDDLPFPEKTSPCGDSEKNVEAKLRNYFGVEYNLRHSSRNRNKECINDDMKVGMLGEDHVQIITVPSSVYNTPPRKTFPPDFKNMTLAEQIDYKMNEIMKKFESKTFYAESSTDSSAEENQPLTNINHFSKCEALFSANATINDTHLKLNKEEPQEVIKKDSVSNETETPIRSTEVNRDSDIKTTLKRKSFVKHVTADSDTIEQLINDTLQENKSDISETSTDTCATVDPKNFKCGFCVSDLDPFCFVCNQSLSKKGSTFRQKCSLYQCGRFYHPECLKMWPQTQWSLIQTTKHKDSDQVVDTFVCPLHVCHTCASDDPRAATSRCSGDKIVKCLRCPSTYHSTNFCVPAGTSILSSTQILCPRHRDRSKFCTINTTWCFLCSEGGNLICCETCPTSVHPECLPVNLTDDDKFICEDCESGRLPLYDEIVWVKLGKFRWWPALILFPNEVPANVLNIRHASGEFVVKFFGTYDYYWVNRGRSFLFQDGDTGHCSSIKKKVDAAFKTAVEEAVVAHKLKKEFKRSQEAESITSLKPPPYIRIKVNKPVGNVRQLDLDLSSTNACECDPSQPQPCGPDSDCLNRLLLTECNPDMCPAGKRCKNQSFEKREYAPLVPYKTQGRGWGLKTLAPIKKGQFVIEYVGEMIDAEEYQRRIQKMHEQKEENYYFLTIDKDRMLDAGPKGNLARFMNHCCQPNCETQKWTVNGDMRVGLFASTGIPADTELTFNYNLECVGKEKKVCRCGAPNCSGFIGVKVKQDAELKKPKKPFKKKTLIEPVILPPCFICGKKGNTRSCNNKVCSKVYHLKCLKLAKWPEGNKFVCPWHHCNVCSKRTIRCCVKCVNSFCPSHSNGNIRYDNLGFVCSRHDPEKASDGEEPVMLKKKKNNVITEEPTVISTTSDDVEDLDLAPLLLRIARFKKANKQTAVDSESENDCYVKSTPRRRRKKQRRYSDSECQEESAISSATLTDVEEEVVVKRKRGRPRKNEFLKKIKLCNVENHEITANSSLNDDSLRDDSNSELSCRGNELENR